MPTPTISLCVISGNEEPHIIRFLESFGPAFDQFCMVRAIGRNKHDKTVSLAKDWCAKNGKDFKFAEYKNAHLVFCHPDAPEVLDDDPSTWPHVDDFAAARNLSWSLATCDWQFWADLDDLIDPDSAATIRACTASEMMDFFLFKYHIHTSGEQNYRERMFRTGTSHWSQPVHENCHTEPLKAVVPADGIKGHYEDKVIYRHEPLCEKERDMNRNMRIMKFQLRYLAAFAYELHREHYYQWQAFRKQEDRDASFKWAKIAEQTELISDLRMQMLLNLADMRHGEKRWDEALELAWQAIRLKTGRREAWGCLAEIELASGSPHRAQVASELMQVMKKPAMSGLPISDRYVGWQGLTLRTRTLRASGQETEAVRLEDGIFKRGGARFSLLHATRGRPVQALNARGNFYKAAFDPMAIEHCFAIDEDDTASLEALKEYRHIVIKEPRGCVKAWNALAAASQGAILVQMSDDWIPCVHWDEGLWLAANAATKEKGGMDAEVGKVPLVFAIKDMNREDALLCMAILTRARFLGQFDTNTGTPDHAPGNPYLFAPEYFGVFSDNEFTHRAYRDGVVLDCKHIQFKHEHPVFEGKPFDQWDETHRRQNMPERYAEGEAIFRRRNPWVIQK